MRARSLDKKVEIWGNISVSDGFGGYTVQDSLIASSWAKVETAKTSVSDLNDIGLNNMTFNLKITLRKRNDVEYSSINQYLKYRGVSYMYTTSPVEVNFNKSFITLTTTKEKVSTVQATIALDSALNTTL